MLWKLVSRACTVLKAPASPRTQGGRLGMTISRTSERRGRFCCKLFVWLWRFKVGCTFVQSVHGVQLFALPVCWCCIGIRDCGLCFLEIRAVHFGVELLNHIHCGHITLSEHWATHSCCKPWSLFFSREQTSRFHRKRPLSCFAFDMRFWRNPLQLRCDQSTFGLASMRHEPLFHFRLTDWNHLIFSDCCCRLRANPRHERAAATAVAKEKTGHLGAAAKRYKTSCSTHVYHYT